MRNCKRDGCDVEGIGSAAAELRVFAHATADCSLGEIVLRCELGDLPMNAEEKRRSREDLKTWLILAAVYVVAAMLMVWIFGAPR